MASLIGTLTDLQATQLALQGLFEAVATNALDMGNLMLENDVEWVKTADDTNATDATAEFVLGYWPRRAKLVSATYVPNGATALAQSTTVYATLQLSWRAGTTAGGLSGALGAAITTLTTSGGTGNWAQWAPVQFTVNAFDPTNCVIPAGGFMTLSIAKASTGTVVPKGTFVARIQFV